MNHYIFNIIRDPEPMNPREECVNFGTMVCWSRQHKLGDEQPQEPSGDWLRRMAGMDDDKMEAALHREYCKLRAGYDHPVTADRQDSLCRDAWEAVVSRCEEWFLREYVALPIHLYEHGDVGYIYVSKDRVRDEFGVKSVTAKVREKVENILRGEVKDYDQYLQGEVYAYEIKELPELPELLDRLGVSELTEEDDIQEIHESFPIEGNEDFEVFDSCYGFYDEEECRRQAKSALAAAEAGHAQRIARQHGQLELTV